MATKSMAKAKPKTTKKTAKTAGKSSSSSKRISEPKKKAADKTKSAAVRKTAAKKTKKAAKVRAASMKKPKAVTAEEQIKDAQKGRGLLIGTRTVFKGIKNGKVSDVFCASNLPETTVMDLEYYSKNSGINVKKFNGNSAKLGEFCGKPFKILLTAAKK